VFTPSGGGPLAPTTGTIAANGSNSTLISGLTINAGALPAAGTTRSDTVWFGQPGILGRLNDFLNTTLGSNGIFQSESNNATSEIQDLNSQINNMNDQLTLQQQSLQQQFTAMEAALAQLQGQGASMLASLGSGAGAATAPVSSATSSGATSTGA